MVRPRTQGGDDLDGMWNDDFHHSAVVALTGRKEAYYDDYRGTPQEFISAAKYGFLYQGQALSLAKSIARILPLSTFPQRSSSVSSKTTIKSRIPDRVNHPCFKLHQRVPPP